ncbi:MAG: cupin domain-containing protein [Thiofilum sp.]|uniref:cupin domain-containing protein n=1 Tax=Thiofilum sp. TaxID=2212733 RepID=UPI0025E33F61|nr:cupin domain-containing protein [Thiofilum sp.]MBK8455500.1 cupin domain-containing protein [Thiofilum sp.]
MSSAILTHLGAMSVEQFLAEYWQQKPLLIRQAFADFTSPISPDELAGIACDVDTARLVIEKGGKTPWEVRHSPLRKRDFTKLPPTHWTLLVNDMNEIEPDLQDIIDPFRFIPDWRIDDLMISYAVEGGSVGPHIDAYDVFLLQGLGQRRWQISTQAVSEENFIPNLDLRIMREFVPEQEWVVEAGDLLYLPPNVPHYGVALGECMTYSVGFRAPSRADLLEELLGHWMELPEAQQRFTDPKRSLQSDPTIISEQDLERLTDFVMEALPDRARVKAWLQEAMVQANDEC